MHNRVVMQDIVQTILERMQRAGASRVINVQLVVGASHSLTAQAVYQRFEKLIEGTPIEGASLTLLWLPARFQCEACGHQFERSEAIEQTSCPNCGGIVLAVEQQDICYVSAIDVDYDDIAAQLVATGGTMPGEMQRVHLIGA